MTFPFAVYSPSALVASGDITFTHRALTGIGPGANPSFAACNIGAEDPTRLVLAFVATPHTINVNTTAVTINGVSARRIGIRLGYNAATAMMMNAWIASVPTGTSVTVATTTSGAPNFAEVVLYRIVNCGTRPFSWRRTTSAAVNSVNVPILTKTGGGFAAYYGISNGSATASISFSGSGTPTENYDSGSGTSLNHTLAGYHLNTVEDSDARSATFTASGAADDMGALMVSFAPSTYQDYFGLTEILCGFNGAFAFADESRHASTITYFGNATIDSTTLKFGSSSLILDGVGDYVSIAQDNRFALSLNGYNRPFTIEGWWRWSADSIATQTLAGQWSTTIGGRRHWVLRRDLTGGRLRFALSPGSTTETFVCSATWAPTLNQWYHICVDFDGTTYRMYVDGVMLSSSTTIVTVADPSANAIPVTIGAQSNPSNYFAGWVDEFSMVMDYAKYASNSGFTVPTAEFARA